MNAAKSNEPPLIPTLTRRELHDLGMAKSLLENPGFTIRLANLLGSPISMGFALLPKGWSNVVNQATRTALLRTLGLAVGTLGRRGQRSHKLFHKVLAGASGSIGGAFGLAALPVELPISTAIMLRSIADVARSEGHDIASMKTRLECLEVFALTGSQPGMSPTESAYWATRSALSKTISEAAAHLARKAVIEPTAPVIVRLVNEVAARFGLLVSEEVAAKAIPVIGAAAGGLINVLFIAHFQDMARGHFIVKRLEQRYGLESVRNAYEAIPIRS